MNYMKAMSQLSHRHPAFWVNHILSNLINSGVVSNNVLLTFSRYRYLPQSFIDERYTFNMPFWCMSDNELLNIIKSLGEGEELAFHSQIFDFGRGYHLPLIDFGNVDRGIIDSSTLRELSSYWKLSFRIYNSGRSYHAYGDRLISNDEWISFMGSLLLLNKSSGFKLIDERWVGHRLMARYSALRWSFNTSQYKRIPEYVGYLNSDGLFSDTATNF
ncbi:hypothetical protein B7L51_011630 [Pectobacterium brasiliense]|uniref:primase 1D-like protein n=1 Tax=Pectobacterium brasiliense TaxID=180957 RepID=UPI001F1867B2|nr:hypothetical protein [Pectobacterium carotovorum]